MLGPRIFWLTAVTSSVLFAEGAYERAVSAYREARLEDALSALDTLPASERDRPAAQNLRSITLLKMGRLDEALAANQAALRVSASPNYMFNTSLIYLAKGDLKDAEAVLQRASVEFPGSAQIQEGLGEAYFRMTRYPDAEQCFRRAVELDPASITAQIGLTKLYYAAGKRSSFAEAARRAMTLAPNNAQACYYYGKYLMDVEGRRAEGVKYMEKSCSIDPAFTEGLIALGGILFSEHRWDDAVKTYEQAVRVEPRNARIYYLLSLAYRRAGSQERAEWAIHEFNSLNRK